MSTNFETFAFLQEAPSQPYRVMGEEHNFYKISMGSLLPWRGGIKAVAEAVSLLMVDSSADNNIKQETIDDKSPDSPAKIIRYETTAKPFEVIQHRDAQRKEAAGKLVDVLADNMTVLANLIMDSMRDDFPDKKTRPTAAQFLEAMPVEAIIDMTKGMLTVNEGILGPFAPLLDQAMKAATKTAEEKLSKIGQDSTTQSD